MSNEIIQSVAYDDYDDFQHSTSCFDKISFHYSKDYLMTKLTLGKVMPSFNTSQNIIFQKSSYKNRPITWRPKTIKLLYSIMNLNTISLPW